MLEMARANVPKGAEFLLQNATDFQLPQPVDAALCTFDSINHLLDSEQVLASFLQISQARRGHTSLTLFRLTGAWQRTDVEYEQRQL